MTDLYVMLFFGVLGYFWRTYDWPRIPFVIAFVLGSVIEKNLALTAQLVSVGRIDLMGSALTLLAVFSVLVAMGWVWVRQSRRVVAEASHSHGIGLGLVALAICSVMLTQVALDPEPYSDYALTVLAGTALLSVWVVVFEIRVLRLMKAAAGWLADLRSSAGHWPGLTMVAGLLPGIGLVGLGPAVAVGVAAWIVFRQPSVQHWSRTMLSAGLTGLLCGGLMHWLLFDWANLPLDTGWLPTLLYEWAVTR
jgi:putative tricarboxylic transport membrane protein